MYINNLSHMTKMATMPIYRILISLKKRKRPKGFICPCTGVKYHNIQTCLLVYAADSGERLQDHWSSGFFFDFRQSNAA